MFNPYPSHPRQRIRRRFALQNLTVLSLHSSLYRFQGPCLQAPAHSLPSGRCRPFRPGR